MCIFLVTMSNRLKRFSVIEAKKKPNTNVILTRKAKHLNNRLMESMCVMHEGMHTFLLKWTPGARWQTITITCTKTIKKRERAKSFSFKSETDLLAVKRL